MLRELRIENFAIIHALELQFDSGLIILTGETGAGKSIVLDAVEILVGGRVGAAMIRADAPRALVEGVFRLNGAERATIHAILEKEDLPGGNVRTELVNGFRIERGPHTFMPSADDIFDLVKMAGLESQLMLSAQ